MTTENNYTYEEAFKELQEIVQQIELGDVGIDQLSDYIKRAAVLVKICEAKLTETEEEVQSLLHKLKEEDNIEETPSEENIVEEETEEVYESDEETEEEIVEEEEVASETKEIEDSEEEVVDEED